MEDVRLVRHKHVGLPGMGGGGGWGSLFPIKFSLCSRVP